MKAFLLAVLVLLALAGTASADYYLQMGPVKREAKATTRAKCGEEGECLRWSVSCKRLTPKRINCVETTWETFSEFPGEAVRCSSTAKYGVGPGGLSTLKYGKARCIFEAA